MVAVQALLVASFAILIVTCFSVAVGFVWVSLGRPTTIALLTMFAVALVFFAQVNEVG